MIPQESKENFKEKEKFVTGPNSGLTPGQFGLLTVGRKITLSLPWVVQWLRLTLSKRPKRLSVSFPSPEDGNRSSFWNVVFSGYLEYRTMGKFHEQWFWEESDSSVRIYIILHKNT
jgi:hypothetical protein